MSVVGFIGVGGLVGLVFWGYINSLSKAEVYSKGDCLMDSLAIYSFIGAFVVSVLVPYLANKYFKKR